MPTGSSRSLLRLKPALLPQVRYRREREGAILFDLSTSGIYATNPAGLTILNRMNGRASCVQILDHLECRFTSVSRRTLQRDLRSFLRALQNAGLIDLQA